MKKRGLVAVLLVVLMTTLCGCARMTTEDAQAYVQGLMDVSYKGEFDKYIEMTGSTEEEAQELYEGNIDATMEETGFSNLGISEELTADYRQLFLDMIKQAKYEVGEATETDDGFSVDVTVEPYTAFDGIKDEMTEVFTEQISDLTEMPSDEELNEMAFRVMYDIMVERIANPVYGDPVTITVSVIPDSDGIYYIPDEDTVALDNAMFPADNF